MAWSPILVGVDDSEASARAAALAVHIARATGAEYRVLHATRDVWSTMRALSTAAAATATAAPRLGDAETNEAWIEAEHAHVRELIARRLPGEAVRHLEIAVGRAPAVLARRAGDLGAGLVVVGGKHHLALGRWLVGTTAHHLARRLDVPLLVAGDAPPAIGRILAAVDLSDAAPVILEEAQRFATEFQASLLALHVIEPLPTGRHYAMGMSQDDFVSRTAEVLETSVWPTLHLPTATHAVKEGPARETIVEECTRWKADLVVVGSHGRDWDDKMLLGRVTESLLNDLPSALLVVPVV